MYNKLDHQKFDVVYHQVDVFQKGNGFHDRLIGKKNSGIDLRNYDNNSNFTKFDLFEFGGVINITLFLRLYFKGLRNFHFQDSRYRYHVSKYCFEKKMPDLIRAFYYFFLENIYSLLSNVIFINKSDGVHIINKLNLIIDCPIHGSFEINKKINGELKIVFIGNFAYEPNIKSLYALSKYKLDFDLHVYGYNTKLIDLQLLNKRVFLHGEIQNFSYLSNNAVYFNFVCYGSGFKNKLTHCINFNIPLIGMEEALNGFFVEEGIDYVKYRSLTDAITFMNKIVKLNEFHYVLKLRI